MERSVLNEYGVIGSLLLEPSIFPQASGLAAEDFALEPLRVVFRAMRRQYSETGTFDALTVRAEAGASCPDVTDELLVRTLETTPTAANLSAYIAAVREASLGRKLSALGAELLDAELAPTEALNRAQEAIRRMAEQGGTGEGVHLADALSGLCDRVERQAEGKAPCVPSGLAELDRMLGGGYINGGLHIIGARPAVGKSALALQITLNAARAGTKVVYVSLEMDPEDCTARLVANLGGGSAARYMFGGQLSQEEYGRFAEGTSKLSRLPIVFNRRSGFSVRQIEALCFREKPGLLVVDHLGLLAPPEGRLSLYEATTRNSRALKLLALRLDIPVICLCQLNRAAASDRSGDFRATMANLRESGAIEQDADTVLLLHNPPCEGDGPGAPSLLQLWLDKNRRGPTGHTEATFYKATGRIVTQ